MLRLCINTAAAVWFNIASFCSWLHVDSLNSSLPLLYPLTGCWGINCNVTQRLRRTLFSYDSAELSWTWGVLHRMSSFFLSFFFGSDWYSSTETLCSNLFQMLWACHCLFSFLPYYVSSIATTISFMPLFFPPAVSQLLLSYLLSDSWHAACCQPITVTRCYLYL